MDDVDVLSGAHVVEVGLRKVSPFLTMRNDERAVDLRLYVDADWRLPPLQADWSPPAGLAVLAVLAEVTMRRVQWASIDEERTLTVAFDDQPDGDLYLQISGRPNENIGTDPWFLDEL